LHPGLSGIKRDVLGRGGKEYRGFPGGAAIFVAFFLLFLSQMLFSVKKEHFAGHMGQP
tara:strand:- start:1087 stop:1260 length:174 start_codon:yes stop_codon:yes gene_type:complete